MYESRVECGMIERFCRCEFRADEEEDSDSTLPVAGGDGEGDGVVCERRADVDESKAEAKTGRDVADCDDRERGCGVLGILSIGMKAGCVDDKINDVDLDGCPNMYSSTKTVSDLRRRSTSPISDELNDNFLFIV